MDKKTREAMERILDVAETHARNVNVWFKKEMNRINNNMPPSQELEAEKMYNEAVGEDIRQLVNELKTIM